MIYLFEFKGYEVYKPQFICFSKVLFFTFQFFWFKLWRCIRILKALQPITSCPVIFLSSKRFYLHFSAFWDFVVVKILSLFNHQEVLEHRCKTLHRLVVYTALKTKLFCIFLRQILQARLLKMYILYEILQKKKNILNPDFINSKLSFMSFSVAIACHYSRISIIWTPINQLCIILSLVRHPFGKQINLYQTYFNLSKPLIIQANFMFHIWFR